MNRFILVLLAAFSAPLAAGAGYPASWTTPVEPFRIAGNIHYVGTEELASYLITTGEGHILVDVPLEENVPHLVEAIRKLGFDPKDIRIILATHAHTDHVGGMRAMRELTGASIYMSARDAELTARGGRNDFAFGNEFSYPPFQPDRIIADGDRITLGETTLTMISTPGHTMGGTSWWTEVDEGNRRLGVIIANSMTAPGFRLDRNPEYPEIMDDYRASFSKLAAYSPDVFLSTHGTFFRLKQKMAAMGGGTNPFVSPGDFPRYLERMKESVESSYASQKAEREVGAVLDDLHEAASEADGTRYFALFTPDAVYIGTDASERWSMEEFRAFAEPYFSAGKGWTYLPVSRHVTLGPGGETAWFDEILDNDAYGITRGTGVLVRDDGEWKIAQYHLTIPVPNDLARDLVDRIRAAD